MTKSKTFECRQCRGTFDQKRGPGRPKVVCSGCVPQHQRHSPDPLLSTSYQAVHKQVRRERGAASEHPCATCGAPAEHWAYDHTDPHPLTAAVGRRKRLAEYSAEISRYQPLCRSCHGRLDSTPADECQRGHPFDEQNTILRPNGRRACRSCRQESQSRWVERRAGAA